MAATNAVGLAISTMSLADVGMRSVRGYKQAVAFPEEFQALLVRLDLSCWKLSTWQKLRANEPHIEDELGQLLLQKIEGSLQKAAQESASYESSTQEDLEAHGVPTPDLTSSSCQTVAALHRHIQRNLRDTSRSMNFWGRVRWVWYHREEFERLVADLDVKIDQLKKLFPPQSDDHASLARERAALVNSLDGPEEIQLLCASCKEEEKELADVARNELNMIEGHQYSDFVVKGDSHHFGDEYHGKYAGRGVTRSGHTYSKFAADVKVMQFGNKYYS